MLKLSRGFFPAFVTSRRVAPKHALPAYITSTGFCSLQVSPDGGQHYYENQMRLYMQNRFKKYSTKTICKV